MTNTSLLVSWDPDYDLATVTGPGGFTQFKMERWQAENFALLLDCPFEVKRVIVRV